jgi:hypothetical protein
VGSVLVAVEPGPVPEALVKSVGATADPNTKKTAAIATIPMRKLFVSGTRMIRSSTKFSRAASGPKELQPRPFAFLTEMSPNTRGFKGLFITLLL